MDREIARRGNSILLKMSDGSIATLVQKDNEWHENFVNCEVCHWPVKIWNGLPPPHPIHFRCIWALRGMV